jgi:hypothetical protein
MSNRVVRCKVFPEIVFLRFKELPAVALSNHEKYNFIKKGFSLPSRLEPRIQNININRQADTCSQIKIKNDNKHHQQITTCLCQTMKP